MERVICGITYMKRFWKTRSFAAIVDTDFTPIIATFPCEKLHMDYYLLPETKNHNKCLLVVIDHFTKKVWLFAHKSKESKYVVDLLEVVVRENKK